MAYKGPDLTGTFGKLTIIKRAENSKHRGKQYECLCLCGNTKIIRSDALVQGRTKSCGCLAYTHNQSKIPEYHIWATMIQRTTNPNCQDYKDYGDRGITVCEEWKKFENFMRDMGFRPNKGWMLERLDNNKGYYKGNVVWADKYTQARNRRNNHIIEYKGQKKTLIEWSEETGIRDVTIRQRLKRGWSVEKSLTWLPKKNVITEEFDECNIQQNDKENA